MTPDELRKAKERDEFVLTPKGEGQVNSIGGKYTFVYFQDFDGTGEVRLIEFPNGDISAIVIKVYVFDDKDKAVAFVLTARYLGHDATRVGSAVIIAEQAYHDILDTTFAIPAAIVAVEEGEAK